MAAEVVWTPDPDSAAELRSVFLVPGETVELVIAASVDASPVIHSTSGSVNGTGRRRVWAPHPADESAALAVDYGPYSLTLKAFALTPFDPATQTQVGEFEIGAYPAAAEIAGLQYVPPEWLLRVDEKDKAQQVSAHFRLAQFLCKQEGGWPKYIVPNTHLYDYLETILAHVRQQGVDAATLHVMSGYRTPYYNALIGNVKHSRHIYGDAVDLFVDTNGDEWMDDIDGSGRIDIGDAELLASWIRAAVTVRDGGSVPGGIGIYAERSWRGPFVHFDLRGREVSWTSGRDNSTDGGD